MCTKLEDQEIEQRIAKAREFKRATHGLTLKSEVFGEPEPRWAEYEPKAKRTPEKQAFGKEYQRQWQLNHRRTVARRRQIETGGTYGITRDTDCSKGVTKFRAFVGKVQVFSCAIEAAKCRNSVMKHKYPDIPEFQIDLDAVWRKWGCTCGSHRRGN